MMGNPKTQIPNPKSQIPIQKAVAGIFLSDVILKLGGANRNWLPLLGMWEEGNHKNTKHGKMK
jgi:hypothetical protein